MDPGREYEGQKGCCGPHSSDATVQRLAISKCGGETFLLPFDDQNIFVAPLHDTQYIEQIHTATLPLYFEISMLDICPSSSRASSPRRHRSARPRVPAAAMMSDKVYCLFLLNLFRGAK